MRHQDVERFFKQYIFGFIRSDIQREIDLARQGKGGGNFLSALGLLCYTEFMGGIATGDKGTARCRFDTFFCLMGNGYRKFCKQVNVYKIFRCGMAHQYFAENCVITMLKTNEAIGIGRLPDGPYYFVVEKYFEDFMRACELLYSHISTMQNPPPLPST